ncbi:MAG: hypothetical protein QXD23_01500 [Candidatus Micrarchaeaceae archaeon]
MNGRKISWDKIMKSLEESISKNVVSDCKDLSIDIKIYSKLWLAVYSLLKMFSEPKYSQVRDIVKINGVIAKLINQCTISEGSEYAEKEFEMKCKITQLGIKSIEINIINGEANGPLHPAKFFHLFLYNIKNIIIYYKILIFRYLKINLINNLKNIKLYLKVKYLYLN